MAFIKDAGPKAGAFHSSPGQGPLSVTTCHDQEAALDRLMLAVNNLCRLMASVQMKLAPNTSQCTEQELDVSEEEFKQLCSE